jgi:hypothetical protein
MTGIASLQPQQLADFSQQLAKYGLGVDDAKGRALSSSDGPIVLDTSGGPSAVAPRILTTNDLDQMRKWIGPSSDSHAAMVKSVSSPYPFAMAAAADHHEEQDRLVTAAHDYIFHGAAFAAAAAKDPGLKSAVEAKLGTMKVAVFAGDTIVVKPGQPLIITGNVPVALHYAEMDIWTGGQVLIYAPGTMTIEVLKKPQSTAAAGRR